MALASVAGEEALLRAIQSTPIIDNHAHPLLKLEAMHKHPLLSIATEAHGDALDSSRTGLAHLRAVKQLSAILGCDSTWEAVSSAIEAKRSGSSHKEWVSRCLSGIECILVDDGLDGADDVEHHSHFDAFTSSPSKRIVRVEQLAASLINEVCATHDSGSAFEVFDETFTAAIVKSLQDPNVVAFKSVICYRTGLDIPQKGDKKAAGLAFQAIFGKQNLPGAAKFARVQHHGLNEYIVHRVAEIIRDEPGQHKKPIQFHTGLGDNDITLTKASPSHLQAFIREYPTVPIVLLHSGYPFVRETGYLATMYLNVYADIGEVFPFVSRDGQEKIVRQILELCPTSKILWSTDGHWFPETYLLAVEQVRKAVRVVLLDYVRRGDLTSNQAIALVENIFFNNSNKLYNLGLSLRQPTGALVVQPSSGNINAQLLAQYLQGKDAPRFLGVWWNDMTAAPRMRSIPIRRVWSLLNSGQEFSFGLATAYHRGLLLNEMGAPGVTAAGEHRLHADFTTLRPGPRKGHITAIGYVTEKDGSPVAICPRSSLKRTLEEASRHGLAFRVGFEMELVFARRDDVTGSYKIVGSPGHNASGVRAMEHEIMEIVEEAIDQLDAGGVYIEMAHAESAPGQFEVIMQNLPALHAVDALVYARDVVSACASARGYRMTLHPKPFANGCGTASHVHMSISSPGGSESQVYEPFYAGILKHLRAINAFTYSNMASYERVQDSCWAGGTWVTWGSQNRETPLRKIEDSHWEMKCMDGLANPYLALSAILSAGVNGIAKKEELIWGNCSADPASLSDDERKKIGMVTRLPRSLPEALEALEEDRVLCDLLGDALVERYTAVKRAEIGFMGAMEDEARRTFIIDRF